MPKQQKKKISKSKQQEQNISSLAEPSHADSSHEAEAKNKKKTKYINLYSQEGKNAQVVLLKGT